MNSALLQKLLTLAEKTGDRLVLVEGDRAVVLLPIDKYEELLVGRYPVAMTEKTAVPGQNSFEALDLSGLKSSGEPPKGSLSAGFLDDFSDEPGEEQFYLEPVD